MLHNKLKSIKTDLEQTVEDITNREKFAKAAISKLTGDLFAALLENGKFRESAVSKYKVGTKEYSFVYTTNIPIKELNELRRTGVSPYSIDDALENKTRVYDWLYVEHSIWRQYDEMAFYVTNRAAAKNIKWLENNIGFDGVTEEAKNIAKAKKLVAHYSEMLRDANKSLNSAVKRMEQIKGSKGSKGRKASERQTKKGEQ